MRPTTLLLITLLTLAAITTGCNTAPRGHAQLVRAHGGVCQDHGCGPAARAALEKLVGCEAADDLRIVVVATARPRAFAWPSGDIVVSCGLARDPQLVTAAVAHECGHLIADGHLPGVVSLTGANDQEALQMEAEADAWAMRLLARIGDSGAGLDRLLHTLEADPTLPAATRGLCHTRRTLLSVEH